jgi:23S rRNA (cytosine1962-C5)-methyltransferase
MVRYGAAVNVPDALSAAIERRAELLTRLHAEHTDCYRLLNGTGEEMPGVTVDRYGPVLLIQTWRQPLETADVEAIGAVAEASLGRALQPVWNHRGGGGQPLYDPVLPADPVGREAGLVYDVRPRHRGSDPLLFLDFRVGRRRVREAGAGSVLNLFAYTCGVGLAAAAGGSTEVVNVDFAASALEVGRANAARNDLVFETVQDDVFPVVRQFAGLSLGRNRRGVVRREPRLFDLVVLDPPRWAKSRFGVVDVVRDYAALLKPALLATREGGAMLVSNNAAQVALEDWLDVLQRCARKAGRPIRDLAVIAPEADFPSFDGRPPLKMAWLLV